MNVFIDGFSKAIEINNNEINVICVENKELFRKIAIELITKKDNNTSIVFSEDFNPMEQKYVELIYDYLNIDFKTSFINKIYDDIVEYCNSEFLEDVIKLRNACNNLCDKLVQEYDYDLDYNRDILLKEILKIKEIRPVIYSENILEILIQYISIIGKYSKIKCFVFLNLHFYFDEEEIIKLYKEIEYRHINCIDIENNYNFNKNQYEKITIIDKDLCEIIED